MRQGLELLQLPHCWLLHFTTQQILQEEITDISLEKKKKCVSLDGKVMIKLGSCFTAGIGRGTWYSIFLNYISVYFKKTGPRTYHQTFLVGILENRFTMRVAKPWNRLPRQTVAALSLGIFQRRLDPYLSGMGYADQWSFPEQGVGLGDLLRSLLAVLSYGAGLQGADRPISSQCPGQFKVWCQAA